MAGSSSALPWTKWLHNRKLGSIDVGYSEEKKVFFLNPPVTNKLYAEVYYENLLLWKVMSLEQQHNWWHDIFQNAKRMPEYYTIMWEGLYCLYDAAIFGNMYKKWKAEARKWIYIPNAKLKCTLTPPEGTYLPVALPFKVRRSARPPHRTRRSSAVLVRG